MADPPAQTGTRRFLVRFNRRADIATRADEAKTGEAGAIRQRCWESALHTHATSYIFQRRARALGVKLNWITYVGFVVPMIVGLLVLSYGHFKSLPTIIAIAAALVSVQVVVSL